MPISELPVTFDLNLVSVDRLNIASTSNSCDFNGRRSAPATPYYAEPAVSRVHERCLESFDRVCHVSRFATRTRSSYLWKDGIIDNRQYVRWFLNMQVNIWMMRVSSLSPLSTISSRIRQEPWTSSGKGDIYGSKIITQRSLSHDTDGSYLVAWKGVGCLRWMFVIIQPLHATISNGSTNHCLWLLRKHRNDFSGYRFWNVWLSLNLAMISPTTRLNPSISSSGIIPAKLMLQPT